LPSWAQPGPPSIASWPQAVEPPARAPTPRFARTLRSGSLAEFVIFRSHGTRLELGRRERLDRALHEDRRGGLGIGRTRSNRARRAPRRDRRGDRRSAGAAAARVFVRGSARALADSV